MVNGYDWLRMECLEKLLYFEKKLKANSCYILIRREYLSISMHLTRANQHKNTISN